MRIAIIGYGKMGHMIESIARERGHEIVCCIDQDNPEAWDSPELRRADVAIEFSTPATAEQNIRQAWAKGLPVVCGTTGWDIEKLKVESLKLKEVESGKLLVDSHNKPVLLWKSNFSVGVNLFFRLNEWLARQMTGLPQYTPSITETHHIHKLDKPSGTAKTLASQITADSPYPCPIASIREGEVPGTHEVRWDSEEDTVVITHIAKGRRGFALGAVLAAEQLTVES